MNGNQPLGSVWLIEIKFLAKVKARISMLTKQNLSDDDLSLNPAKMVEYEMPSVGL